MSQQRTLSAHNQNSNGKRFGILLDVVNDVILGIIFEDKTKLRLIYLF
jgi:hypothetical protein